MEIVPWADLTSGVLLGIAVLMILTGRLVPRAVAERELAVLRESRDLAREEATAWRTAQELGAKALLERDAQMTVLLESDRVTQELLRAMKGNL